MADGGFQLSSIDGGQSRPVHGLQSGDLRLRGAATARRSTSNGASRRRERGKGRASDRRALHRAPAATGGRGRIAALYVTDWVDDGRRYAYDYTSLPSTLFVVSGAIQEDSARSFYRRFRHMAAEARRNRRREQQRQREEDEEDEEEVDEKGGRRNASWHDARAAFMRLRSCARPHGRSGSSAIRSHPAAWLNASRCRVRRRPRPCLPRTECDRPTCSAAAGL